MSEQLLLVGTQVRSTKDRGGDDWASEAREHVCWGVIGTILEIGSGHGTCYLVQHSQSKTKAWYDPEELTTELEMPTEPISPEDLVLCDVHLQEVFGDRASEISDNLRDLLTELWKKAFSEGKEKTRRRVSEMPVTVSFGQGGGGVGGVGGADGTYQGIYSGTVAGGGGGGGVGGGNSSTTSTRTLWQAFSQKLKGKP